MPRLFRPKKLIISLTTICLVLLSLVLTGKSPEELFNLAETPQQQSVQGITTDKQQANIVKVVDGDTITVSINDKKEKIRIIGINTPESVDPRRGVQCFGKEAAKVAKEILNGQTVFLESDASQTNKDKYGRLLRYVWIGDMDFGKLMISEGLAHEYTYEVSYKYQNEYQTAQQQAREAKKGFWSDGACAEESS